MQALHVAGTVTKCPLIRGVRLGKGCTMINRRRFECICLPQKLSVK